jgi:N-acetyl-gamma-glutamyl-phosphate reductase
MAMNKINIGIIGGAGYTGGELLRLLLNHPNVVIDFVHSRSQVGKFVYNIHTDLLGETDLKFTQEINLNIDVVFLCLGHGEANIILAQNKFASHTKIIDLSQDNRIANNDFVYGLPELNKDAIKNAKYIANPGCFATAIQLALLPLAASNLLTSAIHINATTGSTGAGQSLGETSHFSWRQNNLSVYKAFTHQHLLEINQTLQSLQNNTGEIVFIPQRGAFARGILATVVVETNKTLEEAKSIFNTYYSEAPFVFVSENNIDLKQVVNTNKCFLYIEQQGNFICIVSIIDNLLKGAVGQALQNMNIMYGLEETTGLKLKAIAF